MDKAISILESLGVGPTIGYQLVIFMVMFVFLQAVVFRPYLKAFLERQNRTTGSHEAADDLTAQSRELEVVYQRKMRTLNQEIKQTFDKEREKAIKEQDRVLSLAKERAQQTLEGARATIQQEYVRAREELLKDSKTMGQALASQLLIKD